MERTLAIVDRHPVLAWSLLLAAAGILLAGPLPLAPWRPSWTRTLAAHWLAFWRRPSRSAAPALLILFSLPLAGVAWERREEVGRRLAASWSRLLARLPAAPSMTHSPAALLGRAVGGGGEQLRQVVEAGAAGLMSRARAGLHWGAAELHRRVGPEIERRVRHAFDSAGAYVERSVVDPDMPGPVRRLVRASADRVVGGLRRRTLIKVHEVVAAAFGVGDLEDAQAGLRSPAKSTPSHGTRRKTPGRSSSSSSSSSSGDPDPRRPGVLNPTTRALPTVLEDAGEATESPEAPEDDDLHARDRSSSSPSSSSSLCPCRVWDVPSSWSSWSSWPSWSSWSSWWARASRHNRRRVAEVRAAVLYTLSPFDRSLWWRLKQPLWWFFSFLGVLPGVGVLWWLWVLWILDRTDEAQLVSFVVSFESAKFVSTGLLGLLEGSLRFFLCVNVLGTSYAGLDADDSLAGLPSPFDAEASPAPTSISSSSSSSSFSSSPPSFLASSPPLMRIPGQDAHLHSCAQWGPQMREWDAFVFALQVVLVWAAFLFLPYSNRRTSRSTFRYHARSRPRAQSDPANGDSTLESSGAVGRGEGVAPPGVVFPSTPLGIPSPALSVPASVLPHLPRPTDLSSSLASTPAAPLRPTAPRLPPSSTAEATHSGPSTWTPSSPPASSFHATHRASEPSLPPSPSPSPSSPSPSSSPSSPLSSGGGLWATVVHRSRATASAVSSRASRAWTRLAAWSPGLPSFLPSSSSSPSSFSPSSSSSFSPAGPLPSATFSVVDRALIRRPWATLGWRWCPREHHEGRGGEVARLFPFLTAMVVVTLVAFVVAWLALGHAPWRVRLTWFWIRVVYGLLSAPFVVFQIPGVSSVVLGIEPTGYDARGRTVLTRPPRPASDPVAGVATPEDDVTELGEAGTLERTELFEDGWEEALGPEDDEEEEEGGGAAGGRRSIPSTPSALG